MHTGSSSVHAKELLFGLPGSSSIINSDIQVAEDALQRVPVLSGLSDWKPWLQQIEGIAKARGIWDYVDPKGTKQLEEPIRPDTPRLPTFDEFERRRALETAEDYEIRFFEYKCKMDLASRSSAISQDCYHVDCLEYTIKRGEYATAKEEMANLNNAIYLSIADKWRSHLSGDETATPRLKLQKLESLIMEAEPDSHRDASDESPLKSLYSKLNVEGDRNWLVWASDVLGAFHRTDIVSTTLPIDLFLKSVQSHHRDFHDNWSRQLDREACNGSPPTSLPEVVNDFIRSLLLNTTSFEQRPPSNSSLPSLLSTKSTQPAPVAKTKKKTKPADPLQNLKYKHCPGCRETHRIKDGAWWETCWVFHEYVGNKSAPKWFKVTQEKLDCIRTRLSKYPFEEDLALEWNLIR